MGGIRQRCGSTQRNQRRETGSDFTDFNPQFLPISSQRNLLRPPVCLIIIAPSAPVFNSLIYSGWNRNEYTDWDRPSALDPLSMRDSLSSVLSDALIVAPLMHVVHLHAQRSANPSGTFFYHFQGQPSLPILSAVSNPSDQSTGGQEVDLPEYHVLIQSD